MAGITEKRQKRLIFVVVSQLRNTNGLGFAKRNKKIRMVIMIIIIMIMLQKPCLIVVTTVPAFWFKLSFSNYV